VEEEAEPHTYPTSHQVQSNFNSSSCKLIAKFSFEKKLGENIINARSFFISASLKTFCCQTRRRRDSIFPDFWSPKPVFDMLYIPPAPSFSIGEVGNDKLTSLLFVKRRSSLKNE